MYIYLIVKIKRVFRAYFLVIDFSTIGCRLGDLVDAGAPVKSNV